MKYFLDTEFIESGPYKPVQLISIGIVAEDDRRFYGISSEFREEEASDWVRENVLSHLESYARHSLKDLAAAILEFCDPEKHGKPQFWGYYADYDWVVFAQIFGAMMDLPKGFPMYCRDIKQLCDDKGTPDLPEQGKGEHNALADAIWNRAAYEFLTSYAV